MATQRSNTLNIDVGGFNKALETMISQSKRSSKAVIEEQAKGVIRNVIRITPPGRSTKESLGAAGKYGRLKIAADINKVLQGVPVKQAEASDMGTIKTTHRQARKQGQVTHEASRKVRVPKTMLNEYIRAQKKKAGRLMAGWSAAAARFGVPVPAWVTAHSTPSAVKVTASGSKFHMKASNRSPYANKIRMLERQVKHAVQVQAGNMRKRIASKIAQDARRAGFKSGQKAGAAVG
jgi:hypothetical protein